ncbi:MAG TPA: sporulation protein YjcZ [Firmicutes bacterium]|nr:sporulation protein YjcZ [Bacillota bacterium]
MCGNVGQTNNCAFILVLFILLVLVGCACCR